MNFDITRLNNNIDKNIKIDLTYSFNKNQLEGTDLLKLDNVKIVGEFYKNILGNVVLNVDISGIMVLPCAITLKPVEYSFSTTINEELEKLYEESQENSINLQNTIDILPIIWENILMEIPMRVVSPDAEDVELSGDGWKLVKDDEEKNNPLSELMDMLDE